MPEKATLVILDDDETWDKKFKVIVHWSKVHVDPNQESLALKVDAQISQIKGDYLAWLYELGQYKINKNTLTSHLKLFDNLSYWWLTKIAAKNSHTPEIYQVFKLRALENFYFEKKCNELVYCGSNRNLHQILKDWCQKLGQPPRTGKRRSTELQRNTGQVRSLVLVGTMERCSQRLEP